MANLKHITELPVAESADGLNLIVNDNGSAKQIAASAVGAQADWTIEDASSPAYIVNKPLIAPLTLNAEQDYSEDTATGDLVLASILAGRQILVRVPNADGGTYTAIYSPILMYQLPNCENQYLYLFFLRDEKQDLSALLGQSAGTVVMPTYGELKLKLSQEYNSNPLEPTE